MKSEELAGSTIWSSTDDGWLGGSICLYSAERESEMSSNIDGVIGEKLTLRSDRRSIHALAVAGQRCVRSSVLVFIFLTSIRA
jgi:hypothetical protein